MVLTILNINVCSKKLSSGKDVPWQICLDPSILSSGRLFWAEFWPFYVFRFKIPIYAHSDIFLCIWRLQDVHTFTHIIFPGAIFDLRKFDLPHKLKDKFRNVFCSSPTGAAFGDKKMTNIDLNIHPNWPTYPTF